MNNPTMRIFKKNSYKKGSSKFLYSSWFWDFEVHKPNKYKTCRNQEYCWTSILNDFGLFWMYMYQMLFTFLKCFFFNCVIIHESDCKHWPFNIHCMSVIVNNCMSVTFVCGNILEMSLPVICDSNSLLVTYNKMS